MKINKKLIIIISSLLVFSLALFLILFNSIPRLTYTYSDTYDGYVVDGYYGFSKSYEIEESIDDIEVVGISTRAFYKNKNLETIILPKTIKYIDRLAFSECENLKEINLDNVVYIERNAFAYCRSLDNLSISAKHIGSSAFYGCESLKNVELSNTKSIGSYAFSKTSIEEIIIPSSINNIYVDAFSDIKSLKSISVPQTIKITEYIKSLEDENLLIYRS